MVVAYGLVFCATFSRELMLCAGFLALTNVVKDGLNFALVLRVEVCSYSMEKP